MKNLVKALLVVAFFVLVGSVTKADAYTNLTVTQWWNSSHIELPQGVDVTLNSNQCVYAGGVTADACSVPGVTYLRPTATRYDYYYELGHQFDWLHMTAAERLTMAWYMNRPAQRWGDSTASIAAGDEDGLEGVFPSVFAECALGQPAGHMSWSLQFNSHTGVAFVVAPKPGVCVYLKEIANEY